MIIILENRTIPADQIGLVIDRRKHEKEYRKVVTVCNKNGSPLFDLEGVDAQSFMDQYLMYVNNRNRQFEMGYSQTLAYYNHIQAQMAASEDQALDSLLAKADPTKPQ